MIRFLVIFCLLSVSVQASDSLTVESSRQKTAVVELYTSEGCSSCPPADQWLEALLETSTDEFDILALAFHVDYWDYIGWKDRFASSKFTTRQHQLGAINKQSTIYTPEFFVDGRETRGTVNVLEHIGATNATESTLELQLTVTKNGNSLTLELEPSNTLFNGKILHHRYFVFENNLVSQVTRGENSGETLHHQQVVRYMSRAHKLNTSNNYQINIDPAWQLENIGVAALVTTPGNESYLQAVHTPIFPLLAK
ncbi:MAG: DUF1223 domain-containing protein [Gammaproteobacteria bacterium]|nr:DUF1223 domain-containing protein [Gammaproteobacteria bacterium]